MVQFRSFFIHNTVSVADSNGNTQPKQIDMVAITKVIVDEIKAKKQASNTNSLLGKADETSILLAEGEGTVHFNRMHIDVIRLIFNFSR